MRFWSRIFSVTAFAPWAGKKLWYRKLSFSAAGASVVFRPSSALSTTSSLAPRPPAKSFFTARIAALTFLPASSLSSFAACGMCRLLASEEVSVRPLLASERAYVLRPARNPEGRARRTICSPDRCP